MIKVEHGIEVTRVATTFQEGIKALKEEKWDLLLLDHDLSSFSSEGKELTGTDIMYFFLENPEYLPKNIFFVTANPVGRVRMSEIYNQIKSRMEYESH